MNKSELSEALATKTGLSKNQATLVVNSQFDGDDGIIAATLKSGSEVTITGFGTFKKAVRAARTATNPSNGQKVQVAAKAVPKFKAGKTLAETLA